MSKPLRKRMTREESRAQTFERLLDSARDLFGHRGIEATSIEEVAEAAGYSRGAFYSNFKSKDDLICAVLKRELRIANESVAGILEMEVNPAQREAFRQYYIRFCSDEKGCLLWAGMHIYAIQNLEIRPQVAKLFRENRIKLTEAASSVLGELHRHGTPLPFKPEDFFLALIAQAFGLSLAHLLDPESLSMDELRRALALNFDRLTREDLLPSAPIPQTPTGV